MELTDILSQYLYEIQYEELKADAAYQAAKSARDQTIENLTDTMSPEQVQMFHTYMEQTDYLNVLELHHFFDRCTLLIMPQGK